MRYLDYNTRTIGIRVYIEEPAGVWSASEQEHKDKLAFVAARKELERAALIMDEMLATRAGGEKP